MFVRVVALFVGVCVCVARAHRRLCVRINDHHCISIQMFETPIYEAFNSGSCFVRVDVCILCAHRRLCVPVADQHFISRRIFEIFSVRKLSIHKCAYVSYTQMRIYISCTCMHTRVCSYL